MSNIFLELTLIVVLASLLSIIFKLLKQPAVLAYILAGIIIGPFAFFNIENHNLLTAMGQIGITFLLFILGLELRMKELRSIGKIALILGVSQIVFTAAIGYVICLLLGFSLISSLYVSIAITFSSTIIIVKLLADKKDLSSLYGKISVGTLLVQDFVAVLILVLLSGFQIESNSSLSFVNFGTALVKAFILFSVILFLSENIFPKLVDVVAKSQETLFLFSIAWVLGISSLVSSDLIGFSVEIGGLLAGLSLANSSEHFHIGTKMRPLRDFFIVIFFVSLGMEMGIRNIYLIMPPAIILSTFILIGNPIIVIVIMSLLRYSRRTSFLTGLTMAQISEFSLILVFLGKKIGHISEDTVSLMTAIGIITFTASSYMILNGNSLYKFFSRYLKILERKNLIDKNIENTAELANHVILVGAHRTGKCILYTLEDSDDQVAVVDFDPDIINKMKGKAVTCVFGDIIDQEVQEKIQLDKARLIISTVPDIEDNLVLLNEVKKKNKKTKIIVVAQDEKEMKALYANEADYVVMPHLSGGMHIAKMIKSENLEEMIGKMREKEIGFI